MQKSNVIRMINMEFDSNMKFCQSCAMPMTEELYGSNKDGSKNEDYCIYCYENGEFTADISMEEMIDFCVPKPVENTDMDEKTVRKMLNEILWEKLYMRPKGRYFLSFFIININ